MGESSGAKPLHLIRYALILALTWTLVVGGLFGWTYAHRRSQTRALAEAEALAFFNKDQAFRFWATAHGGVYVPVDERTPPNPHLAHVPERDIETPSGKRLTLMNPAYMVRQMMDDYAELYGVRGRITSLKPFREQNTPDDWERRALQGFEQGENEYIEYTDIDGSPYLRLMRPMITSDGCLKCHGVQGYKTGDVRGGVGVSLPLGPLLAAQRQDTFTHALSFATIWAIGLGGIGFSFRSVQRRIREREAADHERMESDRRFRTLVQASPVGMFQADPRGWFTHVNDRWTAISGVSQAQAQGGGWSLGLHPEDRDRVLSQWASCVNDNRPHISEYRFLHENGEIAWVLCNAVPEVDEKGAAIGYVGTITDITARKKAESELILLAKAIEQAAEVIIITAVDGTIIYVNPAYEKTTGFSREEVVGVANGIVSGDEDSEEVREELSETILRGEAWSGRLTGVRKDGGLYTEEATISPVRLPSGEVVNYVAVKRDISEQLSIERQLRQAQKLESIGTLAGGIAHDFNNILYAMIGYTEIAQAELVRDSAAWESLGHVLAAAERAKSLVQQILTFSRQAETERMPIMPHHIVKEAVVFLRASIPTTIEIVQDVDTQTGTILADPTQIHQIVVNLCTNAYHAMEKTGGVLRVSLGRVDVDTEAASVNPELHPGSYCKLVVADTGCGMDKHTLERVFDPFFTTKEQGKGTGLGLATVHGIVTGLGGAIDIDSEPGKGTTFTILIPLIDGVHEEQPGATEAPPLGRGEHVMLVDDEEILVRMGERSLKELGYRVTSFTSPLEALSAFERNPASFDVVMSDQTMPRMSGADLTKRILEIRPEMPVILITGSSESLGKEAALDIGARDWLAKPVHANELAAAIYAALGNGE